MRVLPECRWTGRRGHGRDECRDPGRDRRLEDGRVVGGVVRGQVTDDAGELLDAAGSSEGSRVRSTEEPEDAGDAGCPGEQPDVLAARDGSGVHDASRTEGAVEAGW